MPRLIEWPPNSGRSALYEDHELDFMRRLREQCEAGEITKAELRKQVDVIHDLKVELDATMIPEDEVRPELQQDSLFQIPERVQERLRSPDENRIGKFHGPAAGAPATERQAAILMYPKTGTARRQVLDFIAAQGERGATDEEVSLALNMRLYTAAPRRNELRDDGWVIDTGKTRPTTTRTQAAVWVLTSEGRAAWRSGSP